MKLIAGTCLAAALLAVAPPALAQESEHDAAERRLRACIVAGASGTGGGSLAGAIASVRGLCATQIARLRGIRIAEARRGLPPDEADAAERLATRRLNDEIALAIANFSGLTQ